MPKKSMECRCRTRLPWPRKRCRVRRKDFADVLRNQREVDACNVAAETLPLRLLMDTFMTVENSKGV